MPSQYIYDMSDTWNSGITTYTSIKMNVTNSASAADSLLMDLQIGSSSKFKIDKNGNATLINSDDGAGEAPNLTLLRDSASPAASDALGRIQWQGKDSGGNAEEYAEFYASLVDPTAGSEDASLLLRAKIAGTMTTIAVLSSTGMAVTGAISASADISASGDLTLTSTDAGASAGPAIDLVRDSASPAANDVIGIVNFKGDDSGGNSLTYGAIQATITDPTDGSEDASLQLRAMVAGTLTTIASFSNSSIEMNGLPHFSCRAWVAFNGTGTLAVIGSGNVASVTDNGTGNYTVNFTTAMPDNDYAVVLGTYDGVGFSSGPAATRVSFVTNRATGSVTVQTGYQASGASVNADFPYVSVAIFR